MIKLRQVPLERFMQNFARSLVNVKPLPILAKHQDELGIQASCVNCLHFRELEFKAASGFGGPAEICKKFNMRPPARIIAMSCEAWEDIDDIPF